jgi:hypothetical protein
MVLDMRSDLMKFFRFVVASAAFFIACPALAQNAGTTTNHAFAIGKGAGKQGFSSVLCSSTQIPIGQTSADPACAALSGDVTMDASGVTAIGANKVTNSIIRQSGALSVVGRSANSTGNVADIQATAASDCVFRESGSALGCGTVATGGIANNAVTNGKLVTAADGTIKSNISGGVSTPSDNTITAVLDKLFGTTQGSDVYRGASSWSALTPGTLGQLLSTGGAGANPSWITASGTGTVTSVTCFGSAITTVGTCATAATKSEQQTGTSTTAVVTPSQAHSHDSANKVTANCSVSGGVVTCGFAYGVSSVTRASAGQFTVNFSTNFASINYACQANANGSIGTVFLANTGISAKSVSAISLYVGQASTFAAADPAEFSINCQGRQ